MSIVLSSGMLAISIDAELDLERRGLDQQQSLELVTGELADLLARYRTAATWAVADPAVSAATDRLTHSSVAHEIAILGDRSWVGREAGRSRFARELARRVSRGRTAGLEISSLVLRDTELDDHLDLVVKQGLSAVATAQVPRGRRWFSSSVQPTAMQLCFGLYSFPARAGLPAQRRWLGLRSGIGRVRQAIERAINRRELLHLHLGGLAIASAGRSAMRELERMLRHADRRREQGQLAIGTLAAAVERITGGRQSKPSQSILRPAA